MLLENYKNQGLLSITSVLGATSDKNKFAFRGDLVLKEGELKEGSERDRKPPEVVIYQSVILADSGKFLFVGGLLYRLDQLTLFVEKYRDALAPDTLLLLYVENIDQVLKVEYAGCTFQLLPYGDGMIWNELLELLYLEKSDLKGQTAEDKVKTVADAAMGFDTKTAPISFEQALEKTIEVIKDMAVGPV